MAVTRQVRFPRDFILSIHSKEMLTGPPRSRLAKPQRCVISLIRAIWRVWRLLTYASCPQTRRPPVRPTRGDSRHARFDLKCKPICKKAKQICTACLCARHNPDNVLWRCATFALPRLPAGIFYTQGVKDSSGVVEFSGIAYTEAVSYKLRIMRV